MCSERGGYYYFEFELVVLCIEGTLSFVNINRGNLEYITGFPYFTGEANGARGCGGANSGGCGSGERREGEEVRVAWITGGDSNDGPRSQHVSVGI